jgi:hypothetical protein
MAYKTIRAASIAELNMAIAAEILAGNEPVGPLRAVPATEYPVSATYFQAVDTGTSVTTYRAIAANSDAEFDLAVADAVGDSLVMTGGVQTLAPAFPPALNPDLLHFAVMADVDYLAGGGGGTVPAHTHVKADITDLVLVSTDADNDITAGTDGGAYLDATP